MAERLAFLFGKDPAIAHGGDVTMFRMLRSIAEEQYQTEVICLSHEPERVDDPDVTRVAKPEVRRAALLARAVARRRSLVHTRFDVDGIREAVEASQADRFVAVHSYLAEPVLRAAGVKPGQDLLVSAEVSEAEVWREHGPLGRLEARRLERDERRVARLARAVGTYDRARADNKKVHWLPVTLPPAEAVDVAANPRRLVFLGNRTWGPNARAARRLVGWWPEISQGIDDAELVFVGAPEAPAEVPATVRDLGEIDDVEPVLASSRALVAPIDVGGGVRVKFLEAAARGLPVVTTSAGVGPIESALGIEASVGQEAFIKRCRELLLDADTAGAAGAALHEANSGLWAARRGQDAVLRWLAT